MSKPVKISGSRAAAVLNMSPYKTPVQVWMSIMEEVEPGFCADHNYQYEPFEGNVSTRWGSAFESAIIELTENKLNIKITDREKLFIQDIVSCHVDGIIKGDTLFEGKTTTAFSFRDEWGEPGTDRIPVSYQIQVQNNLMVTGLQSCILSVLVFPRRVEEWEEMGIVPRLIEKNIWRIERPNGNLFDPREWASVLDDMGYFHQYEIHPHPELQALMLQHYREFWEGHVLTGTPPEIKSFEDVKALCPVASGTLVADETVERLAAEYKQITQEIGGSGSLAKRKEQIKIEILKYMITMDSRVEKVLDDDSVEKFILRNREGRKLFQYDGKAFR